MLPNWLVSRRERSPSNLKLGPGSPVAVIGGGPAGSFFSYFLQDMAQRVGIDLHVDIYEPRDFSSPGPGGCNMCGGILSESLVQALGAEGIGLPPTVVQRGIDSYVLHTEVGSVRIETPLHEMRIGAVHRGCGPRGIREIKWEGFDGYLQKLALSKGANLIRGRVDDISWKEGQPEVKVRDGSPRTYELLGVAIGVNSPALKLFEKLELGYHPPVVTRTSIRDYFLGEEEISRFLGNSMHVFLLNIPRLEFAAIIPKGDYVTVCLLGEEIDSELVQSFLGSAEVKKTMPPGWSPDQFTCQCSPHINVQGAIQPFADRMVFIGDCGVTRLYKDGIGAAYRTAKAAATTAVFEGISAEDFRRYFWPACQAISTDNTIGKAIFSVTRQIQRSRLARRAVLRMCESEQGQEGRHRRMSMVLWDMFTGSAPYRDILMRALHPAFLLRFLWGLASSVGPVSGDGRPEKGSMDRPSPLGKTYRDGEVIVREGEMGDCMYVIQEGQVEVLLEKGGKQARLAVMGEGDFFGEMALIEREVRSATVRALGAVRLLSVDKATFLRRIHEDPSLAYRILQKMSHRIRELHDLLGQTKVA
jgi:flavin-dependent dehydrogenase